MPSLIIDDHIPFIKDILEPYARVVYAKGGVITNELARQADGLIIRTRTTCNAHLLHGTNVKFIATATIGYDHIDTGFCDQNGISWNHAPGCNASSVSQYIASVLARLSTSHNFSMHGKRIGIIGVGHVGTRVSHLAKILGMIPLLNDPPRARTEGPGGFVTLEEILETADMITFHVPLNYGGPDRTYHLANMDFFQKLKKKPFIINTSRGAVVDTGSVKAAIRQGMISGYIADVWENEPLIDIELLEMTEIATPHIAGYSVEGKANGTTACVRAASRYFGFGLDDWYPSFLPPPANPIIQPATEGKSPEQLVLNAILSAYDVMKDDIAFRKSPEKFEDLRNNYPVRREIEAFTINLRNPAPSIVEILEGIGFGITIA